jgi:hypothetical protein
MKKRIQFLILFAASLWCIVPAGAATGEGTGLAQGGAAAVGQSVTESVPPVSSPPVAAKPLPQQPSPPAAKPSPQQPSPDRAADMADDAPDKIVINKLKADDVMIEFISKDGKRIKNFTAFTLTGPSRLVIEIKNAVWPFEDKIFPINKLGVLTASFENLPKYLRITLESAHERRLIPYRIEESDPSLNVIVTTPNVLPAQSAAPAS